MRKFFLCFLLLVVTAVPLHAQTAPIVITENQITSDFPETFTFHLALESEIDINRIVLRYGTNERSCQEGGSLQNVTFDAGNLVETEWEWELRRSGAIPPGAVVWWQWEIQDEDGNIVTTDLQEFLVSDESHEWQSVAENGVTVSWYAGSNAFGQAMLEQTTSSLDHLQTNLGLPQPESVQLWFYDSSEAVKDALVNVPEWTGGVAFPEYGITVLGVAPGQEDWAAYIVPHELTHLLEGILTFNCRGIDLPTWLSEGLARYAEGEAEPAAIDRLNNALLDGSLPPLTSLAAGFSAYSDGAGLAYTQSGQVVDYLAETYGSESITMLLETMQQGSDVDEALTAVYGFDTAGLDVAWRTGLGFSPTPTSAAAAAALAATPTTVPTLALGGIPQSSSETGTPEPATAVPIEEPAATAAATGTRPPTATLQSTDTPQAIAENATPSPQPTIVAPSSEPELGIPVWFWILGGLVLTGIVIFIWLKFQKRRG